MNYKCDVCNYETHDLSNFIRHKQSKKHQNNVHKQLTNGNSQNLVSQKLATVSQKLATINSTNKNEKELMCQFCQKIFRHKSSLSKHQNYRCKFKKGNFIDNLELQEQNKKLINVIENQSKITKNTAEVAKKSMNALSFALNNYNDAPPIGLLEDDKFNKMTECLIYDIDGNKKTDRPVDEIIIFHHRKGTLVKVLGELITNEYKKKDPNKQSIWSSDVSRLTFIVKDIIGKTKKSKWITDKKGLHITQTIINPMMQIIKDKLIKYVKSSGNLINKSKIKDEDKTKNLLSKMHDANLALLEIKLGKIHIEILKQIAPYFNLNIANIYDDTRDSNDSD